MYTNTQVHRHDTHTFINTLIHLTICFIYCTKICTCLNYISCGPSQKVLFDIELNVMKNLYKLFQSIILGVLQMLDISHNIKDICQFCINYINSIFSFIFVFQNDGFIFPYPLFWFVGCCPFQILNYCYNIQLFAILLSLFN